MVLGQVLIPIILCAVACALQEPQCTSMFDYEHKLLYKLIKIEEEVKSFRQFVDDLKDKEIKRELEQHQEFKDFLTAIEEEAKNTFADIKTQTAAFNDEQEDIAKERVKDSSQLFKDHEEAIRNLTVKTKDSSQLFKDHEEAIRNLTVKTKDSSQLFKDHEEAIRNLTAKTKDSGQLFKDHEEAIRNLTAKTKDSSQLFKDHEEAIRNLTVKTKDSSQLFKDHEEAIRNLTAKTKDSSQLFKDHEEAIRNLTAETKDSSQLFKDHEEAIRNLTAETKDSSQLFKDHEEAIRNLTVKTKDSNQLFKNHEEAIRNLTAKTKDSSQLFKDHEEAIRNLTLVTEKLNNVKPIGFSLTAPKATATSNQISFDRVITNEGAVFDLDAGEFVCQTPGFYSFTLSLVKHRGGSTYAQCEIQKNGSNQVWAITNPGHSGKHGEYTATNSVYVHLETGDKITVGRCTPLSSLYSVSSFTGFLVKADTA